jgi:hypothetical protein
MVKRQQEVELEELRDFQALFVKIKIEVEKCFLLVQAKILQHLTFSQEMELVL